MRRPTPEIEQMRRDIDGIDAAIKILQARRVQLWAQYSRASVREAIVRGDIRNGHAPAAGRVQGVQAL